MKNITGFIVEVRTREQVAITYSYNGLDKTLLPNESFVGYFRMINCSTENEQAYVEEVIFINEEERTFKNGGEAIFNDQDVSIEIRALCGPFPQDSDFPKRYPKYEIWNRENV